MSGWRPQDTTLVLNWDLQRLRIGSFPYHEHDRRTGVVFHYFCHVCLSVSPADCEVGASRRHLVRGCGRASLLERRVALCTKVR